MYLAMGMTYEQFWEMESWLVKSFRKAHKIRYEEKQNEINYSAWLSGVYTMKALQTGIPVVVNGFVKTHVDLPQFPEKPIDFAANSKAEREKKQMELQRARMQMIAEQFNATFKRKQEAKAKQDSK